ncbi:hypothetical protein ABIC71_001576 [Herbaspirillum seropedicae]
MAGAGVTVVLLGLVLSTLFGSSGLLVLPVTSMAGLAGAGVAVVLLGLVLSALFGSSGLLVLPATSVAGLVGPDRSQR